MAWLALLASLLAPVLYVLTMDHPFLRRTGIVLFVAAGIAILLGGVAIFRGRKRIHRLIAASAMALGILVGVFYQFALDLPDSPVFERSETVAEFELMDHLGQTVRLSELKSKGPVMLVFFRGTW